MFYLSDTLEFYLIYLLIQAMCVKNNVQKIVSIVHIFNIMFTGGLPLPMQVQVKLSFL
jgi:hypothetical protein